MGIRNLARVHEKEIIGKPRNFLVQYPYVLCSRIVLPSRIKLRQRSFLLLGIGVKSDLPAIQVTSL